MIRLALAAGGVLAVVALATVLYASTREERSEEPPPPASREHTILNDGAAPASRLRIEGHFGGGDVLENPPGCASPVRSFFSLFEAEIAWPSACVDPGEQVVIELRGDCLPGCQGWITGWRWE